jgi:hypothetical protein
MLGGLLAAWLAEILVRNYRLLRPHYTSAEFNDANCVLVGAGNLVGSEDLVRGRHATLFISSGDLHTCFNHGW